MNKSRLIGLAICFAGAIGMSAATYDNLFIVGNACEAGWSPEKAMQMEKTADGVFTWSGALSAVANDQERFKFLVQRGWDPCITCRLDVNSHQMVNPGEECDLFVRENGNQGFDNAFQVPETGEYSIVVDLNSMKMTCTVAGSGALQENWEYVKPNLGAQGEGHVFPGVSVPFGMVKLGPDCDDFYANQGWKENGKIHGFSHTHVSGTGGGPKYGNILVQPITGGVNLGDYGSDRSGETFELNRYSVNLTRYNVAVRLTASEKVGMHEYTFPASEEAKLLFDAGSHLKSSFGGESQELVASGAKVLSDTEIEGYSTVKGGWNMGAPYTVYFYAKADTPSKGAKVWKGNSETEGSEVSSTGSEKCGAWFEYTTTEGQKVNLKVGISFISTEQARRNLEEKADLAFDAMRDAGVDKWGEILNVVEVEGSENYKTIFYTSLHHAYLQPTDRTGENPLWNSSEPYFDDWYAIWDTFRATHPLFALVTPNRQADMVRSLIDIWDHEGYMPDGRSGNCNGRVQGGSNADVIIADAYAKGLTGINYENALRAMVKNAETEPQDARKEGRGGSLLYNQLGYVPYEVERSGTRTYENSYCDYGIATVAKGLGREDMYVKYLQRSTNWQNLWNNDIESLGFNGFLWPKTAAGEWVSTDSYNVMWRQDWEGVCYESFPWEMSFYAPHDVATLIELCGGKDRFIERLDTYFTHDKVFDQNYSIGLFQVSNEPGFLVPTLYNYVNRPDKTAEITRKVLKTRYSVMPWGLPGNDDSGSMSAWFAFQAMGLYPNAGQDVYLITSPVFTKTGITLENGKRFEILAPGVSDQNIYVQSAKLNGDELNRCWLRHDEIVAGGTLELVMGGQPSQWCKDGEVPPSAPSVKAASSEIESPSVRIHSYSSCTNNNEGPYNLFAPALDFIKWCDNQTEQPWVVLELNDIYDLDRFVIRDAKTVESFNGNMPEFWIYTSTKGTADEDWTEVVHQTGVADKNIKVVDPDTPVRARYVKLVCTRGHNNNGDAENAIRIYGLDLHGVVAEEIEKNGNISAGSNVIASSNANPFFNNPRHIIDGAASEEFQWEVKPGISEPYYIAFDLGETTTVTALKVSDSGNISRYDVYVSSEMPDSYGNSVWSQAYSGVINGEVEIDPVVCRYVKIEVPADAISGDNAKISEFELYGSDYEAWPEIESPKVRVHSYSSKVNMDEGPFYLLADPDQNKKWCETQNETGWVVFELAHEYELNRFVFRDAKTHEGNENVPEYKIYVSTEGTDDGQWTKVVHQTGVGGVKVKDVSIAPVRARYVKFEPTRGAEEHAALRLYGFDMFGRIAQRADRGELISVGCELIAHSDFAPLFNNPLHIFDGDTDSNTEYKWEVKVDGPDLNFAVIDLEDEYYVNRFKVHDSGKIGSYTVYISNERPQANGDGSWKKVVDGDLNAIAHEFAIPPEKARYVRLEASKSDLVGGCTCEPIYEFEVYGGKKQSSAAVAEEAYKEVVSRSFFDFYGRTLVRPVDGMPCIERIDYSDGTSATRKLMGTRI